MKLQVYCNSSPCGFSVAGVEPENVGPACAMHFIAFPGHAALTVKRVE